MRLPRYYRGKTASEACERALRKGAVLFCRDFFSGRLSSGPPECQQKPGGELSFKHCGAIAGIGETYDEIIENLAASAVDAEYGRNILCALNRKKVLADYAAGNVNYSFEFLRRNEAGELFWGVPDSAPACIPKQGMSLHFFILRISRRQNSRSSF